MKVYILNSAIMPCEGSYYTKKITKNEFIILLQFFSEMNRLVSYIGYEQNKELIKKWSGVDVELNRGELKELEDGDILLIIKLKYRVSEPSEKGKIVNEDDFEFFISKYSSSRQPKIKIFEVEI